MYATSMKDRLLAAAKAKGRAPSPPTPLSQTALSETPLSETPLANSPLADTPPVIEQADPSPAESQREEREAS